MIETSAADLRGRRILVVEDEYLIAREIVDTLSEAGAQTLGPVPRVADALRLIARETRLDGALLDVTLGRENIWPVVDTLLARGIPLLLATGYDVGAIPPAYSHLPRCEKPATGTQLMRALAQAIHSAAPM